jgi:hypothetical protein
LLAFMRICGKGGGLLRYGGRLPNRSVINLREIAGSASGRHVATTIGHPMRHTATLAAASAVCALLAFGGIGSANADERPSAKVYTQQGKAKRATRVKGFQQRGGYYSYTDADVINVYGGSRALYGSMNTYRDPFLDRQTTSGPFDHDFFFDSGMGPRGGDAPYPR